MKYAYARASRNRTSQGQLQSFDRFGVHKEYTSVDGAEEVGAGVSR